MNALLRMTVAAVEAAVAVVCVRVCVGGCVYLALRLASCCINFSTSGVLEPAWALLLLLLPH